MEVNIKGESSLYYELHGTQGPYLLMVHGIMSSRAQWIPNLRALTEFCRPVIVELFGHGRSPSPKNDEAYFPESYIQEFEIIRCKLGLANWFVCGQSLGAALTLRYSLLHPTRITAQIFTNSRSALSDAAESENMKRLVRSMLAGGRGSLDRLPINPARSRFLDPEIKKALVKDIDLIHMEGFANNLLHLIPRCSVRKQLHEIRVPTLLVAGRFDERFSSLMPIAIESIPTLEYVELDGGHAVNIDAADRFNGALQEFILRYCSGASSNGIALEASSSQKMTSDVIEAIRFGFGKPALE
jgi:pimeloyl-ACP methyl ester carboxylesterase